MTLRQTAAADAARAVVRGLRRWMHGPPPAPTPREVFTAFYQDRELDGGRSRSGPGSDLAQTAVLRQRLPELLRELGARAMLDVPCGDFHWMREVELGVDYIGADIVAELVDRNQRLHASPTRRFIELDLIHDDLPAVDLVLCRDLLVHLSFADALAAIRNIERSGAAYLLTTTFPARESNTDISTGDWRPLNLQQPPFGFPAPLAVVNEQCTEDGGIWPDKSLGLWRVGDLGSRTAS